MGDANNLQIPLLNRAAPLGKLIMTRFCTFGIAPAGLLIRSGHNCPQRQYRKVPFFQIRDLQLPGQSVVQREDRLDNDPDRVYATARSKKSFRVLLGGCTADFNKTNDVRSGVGVDSKAFRLRGDGILPRSRLPRRLGKAILRNTVPVCLRR